MSVRVEKDHHTLFQIPVDLFIGLLMHQEHESVVEGSERRANIWILLCKTDGKCLLLKHREIVIIIIHS